MNRFTFTKSARAFLLSSFVAFVSVCWLGCGGDDNPNNGGNNTGGNNTGGNTGKSVDPSTVVKGTFTDSRDGKTYNAVKIGNLTWMAQNLSYATSSGSWCYANYDCNFVSAQNSQDWRLYNWDAAKASCPSGWRLPTRREWGDLAIAAGGTGEYGTGGDAGTKLKSSAGNWAYIKGNWGGGGDVYGFKAEPRGWRMPSGNFMKRDTSGEWWTSTGSTSGRAYSRSMSAADGEIWESDMVTGYGYSVRCVTANSITGGSNTGGGKDTTGGSKDTVVIVKDTLTDIRDGKTYTSVKIGSQTWMAENLNTETDDSWCYKNVDSNCVKYGRLYTWAAAMTACPNGYHLPRSGEWDTLVTAVGGKDVAGKALKSKGGNEKGTDGYGFSALLGGGRDGTSGIFDYAGTVGYWWTTMESGNDYAYMRKINSDAVSATVNTKSAGLSVRCLKD
jgi:uncharacterized protein (TIGR02145 family)